jgi:hypothetical protein
VAKFCAAQAQEVVKLYVALVRELAKLKLRRFTKLSRWSEQEM